MTHGALPESAAVPLLLSLLPPAADADLAPSADDDTSAAAASVGVVEKFANRFASPKTSFSQQFFPPFSSILQLVSELL